MVKKKGKRTTKRLKRAGVKTLNAARARNVRGGVAPIKDGGGSGGGGTGGGGSVFIK